MALGLPHDAGDPLAGPLPLARASGRGEDLAGGGAHHGLLTAGSPALGDERISAALGEGAFWLGAGLAVGLGQPVGPGRLGGTRPPLPQAPGERPCCGGGSDAALGHGREQGREAPVLTGGGLGGRVEALGVEDHGGARGPGGERPYVDDVAGFVRAVADVNRGPLEDALGDETDGRLLPVADLLGLDVELEA